MKTFGLENGKECKDIINDDLCLSFCQLFCINGETGIERAIFLKSAHKDGALPLHRTIFLNILASFVAQNKAFSEIFSIV